MTSTPPTSQAYDPNNIFARILSGDVPAKKVYEDEHVLAFEDINPLAPIHVLVIPKKAGYYDTDSFCQQASAQEQVAWLRAISLVAQQLGLAENGYRVIINQGRHAGQEVPHLHAHILGGDHLGAMLPRHG